jgi:hypothetical protein
MIRMMISLLKPISHGGSDLPLCGQSDWHHLLYTFVNQPYPQAHFGFAIHINSHVGNTGASY